MKKMNRYQVLAIVLLLTWSVLSASHENDFDIYLDAGMKLNQRINFYLPPFKYDLPYLYSPFFALLLSPFSYLPFGVIEFFWMLFMFYSLFDLWKMSKSYFNLQILTQSQLKLWLAATIFYILTSTLFNISQVQMTVFICWTVFKCIHLLEKEKNIFASVLLALIINIKIMPIVFLPYLLYRKYYKAFSYTILFSLFFIFIPILFIGYEFHSLLLKSWWGEINPIANKNLLETEKLYQSVTSAIPVLLTPNTTSMGLKRNILDLSLKNAQLIMNLVRVFLILLTLVFLNSLPFQKSKSKLNTYWEISYLFLIIPLIFPHQHKYAYFLLLPSFIYIIYFLIVQYKQYSNLLLFYFLLITIPFTPFIGRDIIGNNLFDLFQFYRIMVFAALLLIPLLYYCHPKKLIH